MSAGPVVRIAMWSGPRNISTAIMRSFGARADCAVTDEPFYAAYLVATGLIHPMREEVIASQPTDWRKVADALVGPPPDGKPVWCQKHMTHHMLPDFGREWCDGLVNAFLIRAPEAVLASLSRYTHRVAISNSRLIAADASTVTFKVKDYRLDGAARFKTMTLATGEFIRRFLMHVLPKSFHRIRHYGLLANGSRAGNVAKARALLAVSVPVKDPEPENTATSEPSVHARPCPCCGGRMIVIEVFARGSKPRYQPPAMPLIRIDTS